MPEHRRKFSPQFKAEAVQMVISTGKPIAEVARDLGIHDGTLGNWVNAWRRENPEPDQPLSPVERARVKELEEREPPAADGERVPEKSSGLLRADAPVAERCAVIDAEKRQLQDRLDVPPCWACPARRFMPGATGRRLPPRPGAASWPPTCAGSSGPGAARTGAGGSRRS